jgi:hypothetical protein
VRRAPREAGQAAVELVALVPVLLAAGLLAWQLLAVVGAGLRAEEQARQRALRAGAGAGGVATVTVSEAVPALLPGVRGLRIDARASVRTP